jgi:N-methylhydantoinase B/oxoprolinase/acetone carboxylase alpha subunit
VEEELPGKGYVHLHRGDVIAFVGAGGGGYGAPNQGGVTNDASA